MTADCMTAFNSGICARAAGDVRRRRGVAFAARAPRLVIGAIDGETFAGGRFRRRLIDACVGIEMPFVRAARGRTSNP
jgi:hypothetical protein